MRESERNKRKIVIGMLCSVLLLMAVGYAAFAANLNIKGTSNITTSWDVRITNITSKNVVGKASNLEEPSYTNTTATFKTNLISPSDSIEYDITVTNNGDIDAILDKITITDSKNPAIIFTKSGLTEGDTLLGGESKVLTIKVEYSNEVTTQPGNTKADLTVVLDYSQNDGHTVTPSSNVVYRWTTDALYNGDSIEGIQTTTDYTTLGKNHFLKHEVVDGKITSLEACFIYNGNIYCLKGGAGGAAYEANKALLLSVFGEGACSVSDSYGDYYEVSCDATDVYAYVNSTGGVRTRSGSSRCQVHSDGDSECDVLDS